VRQRRVPGRDGDRDRQDAADGRHPAAPPDAVPAPHGQLDRGRARDDGFQGRV
jgi:hypothetical protein